MCWYLAVCFIDMAIKQSVSADIHNMYVTLSSAANDYQKDITFTLIMSQVTMLNGPYKRIDFIVSSLLKLHNKICYLFIAVCVSYFEMLQNIVPSRHARHYQMSFKCL